MIRERKNRQPGANYETFRKGIEHPDPAICANVIIGLIKVANRLSDGQLARLEKDFVEQGGLRERMLHARRKKEPKGVADPKSRAAGHGPSGHPGNPKRPIPLMQVRAMGCAGRRRERLHFARTCIRGIGLNPKMRSGVRPLGRSGFGH
ncbi:MAG: four helix bundle suffix domain-containing protein, partial [Candidatus Sumerlaeota bacterium]|nr:four helix bundle suffix domain-containing protein [Candidatus Sumerlaeota bacterium]